MVSEDGIQLLQGLEEVDYLPNILDRVDRSKCIWQTSRSRTGSSRSYTTRPGLITFMVIAPEHPIIIQKLTNIADLDKVNEKRIQLSFKRIKQQA